MDAIFRVAGTNMNKSEATKWAKKTAGGGCKHVGRVQGNSPGKILTFDTSKLFEITITGITYFFPFLIQGKNLEKPGKSKNFSCLFLEEFVFIQMI